MWRAQHLPDLPIWRSERECDDNARSLSLRAVDRDRASERLDSVSQTDEARAFAQVDDVAIIGLDGIPEALDAVRAGSMSATVSQYPYVMGQMAVEACIAVTRGARLPARVDAPIALVTKSNVADAIATFPKPFRPYSDPLMRLLRGRR